MMKTSVALLVCGLALADDAFIKLNDGHTFPRINLGTCCGSNPAVGVQPWLDAGGVGIDTAASYKNSPAIAAAIAGAQADRSKLYLTTKILAGNGDSDADCAADPSVALAAVQEALTLLNTTYLDLVLMHRPCQQAGLQCGIGPRAGRSQVCNQTGPPRFPPVADAQASNAALWRGLVQAQRQGLVRSIGTSNFDAGELAALPEVVPAVNQIQFAVLGWNASTYEYCRANNIAIETFETINGCPFDDQSVVGPAAAKYGKSAVQVCLRWGLQKAGIVATGTGRNASTAPSYSKDDLDIFDFELTAAEMTALDNYQHDH